MMTLGRSVGAQSPLRYALILFGFARSVIYDGIEAVDGDPLQDFCVADLDNMQITVNGLPCRPPSDVVSADFASSLLREARNLNQALGSGVNLANALTFPGLNTLGVSMARIDFQPGGLNPPHIHPRATEILFVARGTLLVGFISTTNQLYSQTLQEGDIFVFPPGLPHFQLNTDTQFPALSIVAFNSQDPGVSQLAASLFTAQPPIPARVLQITLGIHDQQELDYIINSVARS
ncbi:hypothetical protein KP509_02G081800 [Ceratopteris richardii]|uniref:Germin-like protein n=1 Tax=Ceratopteris richardii TaxID=49495 RepID=A0A8T2VAY0_CERRI|nr:hypothetical protein KP509_02G081800 [Ceratopteris richardii]